MAFFITHMANYYGFSFPQGFFLGDPDWFKRLEVKIKPDDFDPFESGLSQVFNILHDVLEGSKSKSIHGGCYMKLYGDCIINIQEGIDRYIELHPGNIFLLA